MYVAKFRLVVYVNAIRVPVARQLTHVSYMSTCPAPHVNVALVSIVYPYFICTLTFVYLISFSYIFGSFLGGKKQAVVTDARIVLRRCCCIERQSEAHDINK